MQITQIHYILVLKLIALDASLIKDVPDIDPKSQEKGWEVKKILNINLINNN